MEASPDPGEQVGLGLGSVRDQPSVAAGFVTAIGAAGIDQIILKQVGMARLLDELAENLRAGRYRPLPSRRAYISKPGAAERRPLSIPAVRDRILQAAVKIVIEPVFEADFLPCSFGFRPKRAANDVLDLRGGSPSLLPQDVADHAHRTLSPTLDIVDAVWETAAGD